MTTSLPTILSAAGGLAVLGTWVAYFSTIPSGKVPERPVGSVIFQLLGMALGLAGIALGLSSGSPLGYSVTVPAGFAIWMGGFFLFLLTQRKTPIGDIRVKVGDALPAFATQTAAGETFRTESLAGRRVLLKFFRGHW